MDDTFRRQWAIQLAKERADQARAWTPTYDEPERRPLERSRWLGLQIRSLLALVAVAEEGSFVQAARRLGYSRSTISHQIAQLESAIGESLVVRGSGSRSVTVTPAGSLVVAHGRAVLKVLEISVLMAAYPSPAIAHPGLRQPRGLGPPWRRAR